jgi:hypothetical protein
VVELFTVREVQYKQKKRVFGQTVDHEPGQNFIDVQSGTSCSRAPSNGMRYM